MKAINIYREAIKRTFAAPKLPADETASEPTPSEENKPGKSLRQKLEEAGIEVLPGEHPTREVFTEASLKGSRVQKYCRNRELLSADFDDG